MICCSEVTCSNQIFYGPSKKMMKSKEQIMCLITKEACLTQDNLLRRGIHVTNRCYMCCVRVGKSPTLVGEWTGNLCICTWAILPSWASFWDWVRPRRHIFIWYESIGENKQVIIGQFPVAVGSDLCQLFLIFLSVGVAQNQPHHEAWKASATKPQPESPENLTPHALTSR